MAKALREALFGIFAALADQRDPPAPDRDVFDAHLAAALLRRGPESLGGTSGVKDAAGRWAGAGPMVSRMCSGPAQVAAGC